MVTKHFSKEKKRKKTNYQIHFTDRTLLNVYTTVPVEYSIKEGKKK